MNKEFKNLSWDRLYHHMSGIRLIDGLKNWKGHIYYGKIFSVEKDGYYDEWHENPQYRSRSVYRPHDRRFVEWKIIDDLRAYLNRYTDNAKMYINMDNPDEYLVLIKCKKNGKVEYALRQIGFKVFYTCHD